MVVTDNRLHTYLLKQEVGVAMDIVRYGTRLGKEKSGAYLFLPDGPAQSLLTSSTQPRVAVTTGPLVIHHILCILGATVF